MRLVCLHADTIDALKRLSIQFDDLTPNGLWSSQYHLVGLTRAQLDALETFQVPVEDVTPAQLAQATAQETQSAVRPSAQGSAVAGGQRVVATVGAAGIAGTPDDLGEERTRAVAGAEAEVPLTQGRDAGTRAAEARPEPRPDGKGAGQAAAQVGGTQTGAQPAQTSGGQAAATPEERGRQGGAARGRADRAGRRPEGPAGDRPEPGGRAALRYHAPAYQRRREVHRGDRREW
jgi:hypothetical protein